MRPVPYGNSLRVPKSPADWTLESNEEDDYDGGRAAAETRKTGDDNDPDFQGLETYPHLITQP